MMKQYSEEKIDVVSIFQKLKSLGLKVPKLKKFISSIPKQAKPISTSNNKIFGINISEQEQIAVEDYLLPKFIVTTTDYLKKYVNREIGLFRKAGSKVRQKDLQVKLERGESIENSEPNDVACLLKKWLRELPEPLIPSYLHDLFIRCLNLPVEDCKVEAISLCCQLLPFDHFFTLKYLLVFLSEIVKHCDKNKMGAHNLAVIMAPNIFVMRNEPVDKSSNDLLKQHTSITELLIRNVHKIKSPYSSAEYLTESLKLDADLDTSSFGLDYSPSKSTKKRRSVGVQDLFSGIKKLVGQNSVSPNRKRSFQDDFHTDTRSALKRKADEHSPDDEHSMSPLKKQAIASSVLCDESSKTPNNKIPKIEKSRKGHTRNKSFNLWKKKEKNRQKSEKCNALNSKVTVSTTDSFKENLVFSLQISAENNESLLTPPSISPINFENLFTKSAFIKKSYSDCYLIPNYVKPQNKMFSTSSEGCLPVENIPSPCYNNTSKTLDQKDTLKVPDIILSETLSCDETIVNLKTENALLSTVKKSTSDVNILKSNVRDINAVPTIISVESNKTSAVSKLHNEEKVKRNCSITRQEAFIIKPKNSKATTISKLRRADSIKISKLRNNHLNIQNDTSVINSKVIKKSNSNSAAEVLPNTKANENNALSNDKKHKKKNVRNSSIVRGRPNTIKTGLPNDVCSRYMNDSVCDNTHHRPVSCSSSVDNDLFINIVKKSDPDLSITNKMENLTLSPKKTISMKEDEFKTELLNYIDSVIFPLKYDELKCITDEDCVEPDTVNEISLKDKTVKLEEPESIKADDSRMVLRRQSRERLCSSSDSKVKKTKKSTKISRINSFPESASNKPRKGEKLRIVKSFSPEPNLIKSDESKTVLRRKSRERLRSNSDSKVQKRKKSVKVSRINSYPKHPATTKTRKVKKLRVVKSSSPKNEFIKIDTPISKTKSRKSLSSNSDEKLPDAKNNSTKDFKITSSEHTPVVKSRKTEKLIVVESSGVKESGKKVCKNSDKTDEDHQYSEEVQKQIHLDVKTPKNRSESPEQWFSGRKFLEAEEANQKEICDHKRESIAMILRNKKGHVREKASLYEPATRTTPMLLRNATPCVNFCSSQCNMQSSQKKSTSTRSSKSTRRNSPLPLPPIPIFFEPSPSPAPSYPLKELTNLSNSEDMFYTPPSAQKSLNSSQNNEKLSKEKKNKCTLKPKMNSYSGHTPFKLPVDRNKVRRSASSPKCHSPISNENYYCSPVLKSRSALSIEKLKSNEMLDEWNCEM